MVQAGPWMHTHHMARIDRAGLPSSVTSSVGGRHIDPQIFEGMRRGSNSKKLVSKDDPRALEVSKSHHENKRKEDENEDETLETQR